MRYKSKTERVTKYDIDGKAYTVLVDVPYDAANQSKRREGILIGDFIHFEDGSTKEASGGACHCPPCDPQFPKQVWGYKLLFFAEKSELLCAEFDELKDMLDKRADTFVLELKDGSKVDAMERLESLATEIVRCEEKKHECNLKLGRVREPEPEPTFSDEHMEAYSKREDEKKEFYEKLDKVKRAEATDTDRTITGRR